jgi:transposase InsO family protein
MLAGIETMLRHKDILQGVHFKWITDHKGLIYLLNQKSVSGRQARWLEKISSFIFEVVYIAGNENVLADALSRMYSNDDSGTERARSEFTTFDIVDEDSGDSSGMVVLAGINAIVATHRNSNKTVVPGPETGRPETSKEFASRMKDMFVLRGPQDRTMGEKGKNKELPLTNKETTDLHNKEDVDHEDVDHEDTTSDDQSDRTPDPEPTLVNVLKDDAGFDLLKEIQGHYKNDPIFKTILERPKEFRNFEVIDNLIYLKLNGKNLLCIPKMTINGRSIYEIIISEAHSMLAHLGANKNLNYLRDHVWWKDMVPHTKSFCETCITCKRSKPNNQKPFGLLNPLAVPSEPWEAIGIDFIGPLPLSRNRDSEFDSLTVVICLLTAMVELIPSCTTYKAKDIAELMFENVYKHHGLPKTIVSDRDVLFTSTFWEHLNKLIGIKLKMSSAYHPQTDGATERANRTITQMLRQCIDPKQKDWVNKIPTIQFAINSARSESTGYAPFFLNNVRIPRAMVWNSASPMEYSNVREFAKKKKLALMSAHDSIIAARVKQTRDANRKRQLAPFTDGDFVYLSTKNITFEKGLARKLIPKFIGPYKIIQDFNNQSFRIELPTHLKRRGVHDVFHSSLLKIHVPNDDRLFPGRMDTQIGSGPDSDDEWAVDKIKSHAGSGEDSVFEILWKSGDVTWMPHYQIRHLQALESYLELMGVDVVSKLTTGKGKPPLDDPQIFLGAMSLSPPFPNELLSVPVSSPSHKPLFSSFLDIMNLTIFDFIHPSILHSNFHLPSSSSISLEPFMRGITHPQFTRYSNTDYILTNPTSPYKRILHTGHIAKCLNYDKALRDGRTPDQVLGIPLGYDEFAEIFNEYKRPNDKRELSTTGVERTKGTIRKSRHPVTLRDFFITAEQCGLGAPNKDKEAEESALVFERYAKDKAKSDKRRDEAIQKRKEKRRENFSGPVKPNKRGRYFNNQEENEEDYDDEDPNSVLEIFEDIPQLPVNQPTPGPIASTSTPTPVHVDASNLPTIIDLRVANRDVAAPEVVTTSAVNAANFILAPEFDEYLQPPQEMQLMQE